MVLQLASELVWASLSKELFAVLGMVTEKGEARTVGVVYIVHEHKLYIVTGKDTWKARHMSQNAHVSVTVPIAKRIPFLFWIKIPAATITFSGLATVQSADGVSKDILKSLLRTETPDNLGGMCVIEVQPVGDFVTYGIGVPLMAMRTPEKARGRAGGSQISTVQRRSSGLNPVTADSAILRGVYSLLKEYPHESALSCPCPQSRLPVEPRRNCLGARRHPR